MGVIGATAAMESLGPEDEGDLSMFNLKALHWDEGEQTKATALHSHSTNPHSLWGDTRSESFESTAGV